VKLYKVVANIVDEYYMSSVRQVDTLLTAATQSILLQITWSEAFKVCYLFVNHSYNSNVKCGRSIMLVFAYQRSGQNSNKVVKIGIIRQLSDVKNSASFFSTLVVAERDETWNSQTQKNSTKFIQLYLLTPLFLLHINERTEFYITDYALDILV